MKNNAIQVLAASLVILFSAGCSESRPPANEITFEGKLLSSFDVNMKLAYDSIPGKVKAEYTARVLSMYDGLLLDGEIKADSTMELTGNNSCNLMFPDGNRHFEQKDTWKLKLGRDGNGSFTLVGEMESDGPLGGSVSLMEKSGSADSTEVKTERDI